MISIIERDAGMAQFVVRNIEDGVKSRLQRRARRNGRSMEEEVREILRAAAREKDASEAGLGTRIANLIKGTGLNFDAPELRGHVLKPPSFEE
jgi:plasmid stability protein